MAASVSALIEAVLFAEGGPVTKKRLGTLLGVGDAALLQGAHELSELLSNRGLTLVETETELELRTSPETGDIVKKLRESELSKDLGKAGLETLAIILYRGGASRSEIDWIRGVNSGQTVRSLLLRGLVSRSEDPGDKRRFRYSATTEALSHLGVSRLADLPRYAELKSETSAAIARAEAETVTS